MAAVLMSQTDTGGPDLIGPDLSGDVLLIGAGDLGSSIGERLAALPGRPTVWAVRRRADLVEAPLHGLAADLTREQPGLPATLDLDALVVCLTARPRSEESYRATYVDGMARALDAVADVGAPRRALLISSTGVLGDLEGWVDETAEPRPADGPASVLLEAEQRFVDRLPHGTVLRLSGLYGRGRPRLVDQVRRGEVGDLGRWTNRIHRDDAAAAAVHLIADVRDPEPLYLGTDDEPAMLADVAEHVAAQLGVDPPTRPEDLTGHGKRLSNARLRSTGWVPAYPTFREGYTDLD